MNKPVVIILALSFVISSVNLFLLSTIPGEIDRAKEHVEQFVLSKINNPLPSVSEPVPQETSAQEPLPPLQEPELKKVEDIDSRLQQDGSTPTIEKLSSAVSEIDGWLFAEEEEVNAGKRIETLTQSLRHRISQEITSLLKTALEAKNGTAAAVQMSRINSLLALYPSPTSEEQKSSLDEITKNILSTSKRIEELQRLRYNQWAIEQIKNELLEYRKLTKITTFEDLKKIVVTDKNALLKICIDYLQVVDPGLLEPAALDLYNHAYTLTRNALGEDDAQLIALAKGLSNPNTRWSLSKF